MDINISRKISDNIKHLYTNRKGSKSVNSILENSDELFKGIELEIEVFHSEILKKYKNRYIGVNFEFVELNEKIGINPKLNLLTKFNLKDAKLENNKRFQDELSKIRTKYSFGNWLRENKKDFISFGYNIDEKKLFFLDDNFNPELLTKLKSHQLDNDETGLKQLVKSFGVTEGNVYYFARLIGFDGEKSSGNIALVFHSNEIIKKNEIEKYDILFTQTSYQCLEVLSLVKSKVLVFFRETEKIAHIKSAKAAIMSRNMSHNLGSHVMSHLKSKLYSVSDIVSHKALKNLNKEANDWEDIKKEINEINEINEIELPFLVGLGRFINYLQERQDYIATVSTNYIPFSSPISFKDFIYDELKPDLRYERHNGRDNDAGFKGKQAENLLLGYIADSEGFKGSDSIILKFGNFDGKKENIESPDFKKLREIEISVPGGITGRQAFFSIIENIIRNTAKHSIPSVTPHKEMELYFNVVEDNNEIKVLEREIGVEENTYINFKDDFHILTIHSNLESYISDFDTIKKGLTSDYIEADGQINEDYKGIKEMRISAAWLRGKTIDTEITQEEPPALACRIINKNESKGKCNLQYIICVPKPQKVLIVLDDTSHLNLPTIQKQMRPYFWNVCCKSDFLNQRNFGDYEMIVAGSSTIKTSIRPFSSARIIIDDTIPEKLAKILKPDFNFEQLQTQFYKQWINDNFGSELATISILDKKTPEENILYKDKDKISIKNDEITSGYANSIVYTTHYTGIKNELNRIKDSDKEHKLYSRMEAKFIEGITGNNSTDRIVRKSQWDEQTYYKHIASSLAKVAVFDERIFKYVSPKKEGNKVDIKKILNDIKEDNFREKLNALCRALENHDVNTDIIRKLKYFFEEIKSFDLDNEKIKEAVLEINFSRQNEEYKTENTQCYYEKRIWAFDLVFPTQQGEPIVILGYDAPIEDKLSYKETYNIKTIGKISKNCDTDFQLEFTGKYLHGKNKFDFGLIHQGLLDKIYGHFNINTVEKQKEAKKSFTKCFYNDLIKETFKVDAKTDEFLPRLIIHSGRSRPSEKDMPQHQPFIQFSSVENALKDCKFTLMELLYSAHYENNNTNS